MTLFRSPAVPRTASAIGRLGARHDATTKIAEALIRLPECCELSPCPDACEPRTRPGGGETGGEAGGRPRPATPVLGAVPGLPGGWVERGGGAPHRRGMARGSRPYSWPGR